MFAYCRARTVATLSARPASACAGRNAPSKLSLQDSRHSPHSSNASLFGKLAFHGKRASSFAVAAVSRETEEHQQSEQNAGGRGEELLEELKGLNRQEDEAAEEPMEGIPLPKPEFVKVNKAEFVKSSVELSQCPKANVKWPEFAVIGRSNVGKSSLINMLTNHKGLAMTSKQPGKTKCINHFHINKDLGNKGAWYLVDLPGYGYAKSAKTMRVEWNKFTQDYFLNRESLANVLLLVDASIPPTDIDLSCAEWLAESQVPFAIIFTKTDKRKKKTPSPKQNMEAFEQELLKSWENLPPILVTSAEKNEGRLELLNYIASLREFFKQQH